MKTQGFYINFYFSPENLFLFKVPRLHDFKVKIFITVQVPKFLNKNNEKLFFISQS